VKQTLALIPKPQSAIVGDGVFVLTSEATVSYPPEGTQAARLIRNLTGFVSQAEGSQIRFELDTAIRGEEAYHLDVDPDGVRISASTAAGLFYGAQTLRQLLPAGVETGRAAAPFEVPYLHIEDAPRFLHRGFMLDVSRYFFGVEDIKRIIDLLALQKINRFHWHLTDDQGWRIEIKKYPRLAEVGSKRRESQVGGWLLSKPVYDSIPHGGYYTQEQVREVVAYARANFIEVIPEIDAPGHAIAAIAAYPELSCTGMPIEVRTSVGAAFSKPMCTGKEGVFEFLDDVLSEVVELFPYKHIHVGGDEVKTKEWQKCPHCRARMAAEGLQKAHDLQAYFENRLVKILKSKGCQVIAWSEAVHDALDKGVINQFWLFASKKRTISELKNGRRTIVSDFSSLYLDYPCRLIPLIKTYTFEPQYSEVTAEQAGNILGVEAALWTEFVHSRARLDWQTFPRLLAVSETAWTSKDGRDYQDFLRRLDTFEKRLDALDVQYATREFTVKYQKISRIPPWLKMLFAKDQPALLEYRQYHPAK
jgi:hexosaminidase